MFPLSITARYHGRWPTTTRWSAEDKHRDAHKAEFRLVPCLAALVVCYNACGGRVHYLITSDCPIIRAAEAERSQRELFLWKTNSGPGVTCVSAGSGIKQLSEPFWILLAPSTTLYLAPKMPNPTFYIRDTSLEVLFSCRTLRIIVR